MRREAFIDYIEKEVPQPQVETALGFSILKYMNHLVGCASNPNMIDVIRSTTLFPLSDCHCSRSPPPFAFYMLENWIIAPFTGPSF